MDCESFMEDVCRRHPGDREYHQAVREVLEHVAPLLESRPHYRDACILERLTEPDRMIRFRVCWEDDEGKVRMNRAWRVQFNDALGPYKGGLRFHPTVTPSVLKFLGFEQIFKNALTGLPLGGGKGGADFDPKGRSTREIMRFCQALMSELHRHIGEDVDIPAGDIGVGSREIGFLFGHYKRLRNRHAGIITGKDPCWGGSELRTEATGYGLVHFVRLILEGRGEQLEGRRVAISGAGNVAIHAAEKALREGAKVVALSDSRGTLRFEESLDEERLAQIAKAKMDGGKQLADVADEVRGEHVEGARPWSVPCDIALPCATQNELGEEDARALRDHGCQVVAEGANMPCTPEASAVFRDSQIAFAPGKAANAGGVAVSGLELTQHSSGLPWSRETVDKELRGIMRAIHERCSEHGGTKNGVDYVRGANRAGFLRVAEAMYAQGVD